MKVGCMRVQAHCSTIKASYPSKVNRRPSTTASLSSSRYLRATGSVNTSLWWPCCGDCPSGPLSCVDGTSFVLMECFANSRGADVGGGAWPPVCVAGGGMVKTGNSLAHKGCIYGVSTIGVRVNSRNLKKRKSGGRAQIKAKETEALTLRGSYRIVQR